MLPSLYLSRQLKNQIADDIPLQEIVGDQSGGLLVVGWGSTYGPISRAVSNLRDQGHRVSHMHIRHIWPLPRNLPELLTGFDKILVPEMNNGQLISIIRDKYLIDAKGLHKIKGMPFTAQEIKNKVVDLV